MKPDEPLDNLPNTVIVDKLDQLIGVILDNKIKPRVSLDSTLWNTQEVADYLGFSYKYTNEYIITEYSFPGELRFPLKNEKKSHPRWYAGEVMAWAAQYQNKRHWEGRQGIHKVSTIPSSELHQQSLPTMTVSPPID